MADTLESILSTACVGCGRKSREGQPTLSYLSAFSASLREPLSAPSFSSASWRDAEGVSRGGAEGGVSQRRKERREDLRGRCNATVFFLGHVACGREFRKSLLRNDPVDDLAAELAELLEPTGVVVSQFVVVESQQTQECHMEVT